jgi:hypothetical protein
MESNVFPKKVEITEYSSDEEECPDTVSTEHVEINTLYSKDNHYLIVGIYGQSSGYLKVALNEELKADGNSYKVKFLAASTKEKNKPKKVVAELHQFKHKDGYNLVLYTKSDIRAQNYKYIVDYLCNTDNLTFKQAIVFDSFHLSKTFLPEGTKDTLYCLKNRKQMASNQMIKCAGFPSPNGLSDFPAYLLTCFEFKDIACVVYIAVTSLLEVCIDSIKLYDGVSVTYEFLRDKFGEDRLKKINATLLLKEFNSFKNTFYT